MSNLQWFRLYHRMIDDEKLRLLAFEDRWHFIAVCCLKADGLLDEPEGPLKWRKVAVKMGVQARELDEIKRRLSEVGLVDENMQPLAWDDLQYRSDTSTERVRKYRGKTKASEPKQPRNVSVTPQETDTETEISSLRSESARQASPRQQLETVIDADRAGAVLEHRQRIRKPLTAHAAKLLAGKFAKCADPNAAADAMIANGWQGFEPEWLVNRQSRGSPPNQPRGSDYFDIAAEFLENAQGRTAIGHQGHRGDASRLPELAIGHDATHRPGLHHGD